MTERGRKSPLDYGSFIVLNGKHLNLRKHSKDFTVIGNSRIFSSKGCGRYKKMTQNITRVTTADEENIDHLMAEARKDSVAHHIYQIAGTDEEIIIDDRIILNLRREGTGEIEKIIQDFKLVPEGRMGNAYILRVTNATGKNPLKVANEIAEREGVAGCSPQVLLEHGFHE